MEFYRPKRQTPAIPIVALIDILVILLIFFIITSQPKKKRTIMDISVPVASESSMKTIIDSRSILAVSAGGQLTLDGIVLRDQQMLIDYLKALKEDNPSVKLEMEMDEKVRLEQMIMISEALTTAGFEANLPTRVRKTKPTT